MKVFLDTNVVVDFLGEREPFFQNAAKIFELWRKREIGLSLSALTIVNSAYILHKAYSKETMMDKIKWLCRSFEVTPTADFAAKIHFSSARARNYSSQN